MKILDTKELLTFSIKVTEEIQSKNLLPFLRTSLLHSGLKLHKNSYFYYSFHIKTLTYELIIFVKPSQDTFLEPFLFSENYGEEKENCVYVTSLYFVFFQNQKLILFKNISENSLEDIEIYISQLYNLNDVKIKLVEQEELETLKNTKSKSSIEKPTYKTYAVNKDNSFNIFLSFLLMSFLSFLFIVYFSYENNSSRIINKKIVNQNKITKNVHKKPFDKIIPLLKEMNGYNLLTKKIQFKHTKLEVILYHQNKEELLKFLNTTKYKIFMKSLNYNIAQNSYSMDVIIEL
jgi:hypothetical protein